LFVPKIISAGESMVSDTTTMNGMPSLRVDTISSLLEKGKPGKFLARDGLQIIPVIEFDAGIRNPRVANTAWFHIKYPSGLF
jgi:hypothetical protein